jgi:GST-like protein
MGLAYRLLPVNLRQGKPRADAIKALNRNAKVPVLIDRSIADGGHVVLSDSAAILVYLAEKSGQLLRATLPAELRSLSTFSFMPLVSARPT